MEQHPVPQNVTTFQFRLIGDMTIKQFGYLAGGAMLAYIFYKLPLPFFFTWPLAILAALCGFGFAFIPIEERPMDIWVLSFFKSVYSPTQYVWTHQTPTSVPLTVTTPQSTISPQETPLSTRRTDVLQNIFTPPASPHTATSRGPLNFIFNLLTPKPKQEKESVNVPNAPTMPNQQPTLSPTLTDRMDFSPPPVVLTNGETQQAIADTQKKEQEVENKLQNVQKELEEKSMAQSQIIQMQQQLNELLAQRAKMEKELSALREKNTPYPSSPPFFQPDAPHPTITGPTTIAATLNIPHQPTVRIITPDQAIKVGLPRLTTFPNVVTGIVKDRDNNLLPGVLVTVKDREGVPLRALKTNRLGQFAASTPLPNGVYLVEIEDPRLRYTFDRAQITLNGSIVPALEILAKSQKEITRAKLEKELFGDTTNG